MAKKIKFSQLEATPSKDTEAVHRTGDESVDGYKTFGKPIVSNSATSISMAAFGDNRNVPNVISNLSGGSYYSSETGHIFKISFKRDYSSMSQLIVNIFSGYSGGVCEILITMYGKNNVSTYRRCHYISGNIEIFKALRIFCFYDDVDETDNIYLVINDFNYPSIIPVGLIAAGVDSKYALDSYKIEYFGDDITAIQNGAIEILGSKKIGSQTAGLSDLNNYLPLSGGTLSGHVDTQIGFTLKSDGKKRLRFGGHSVLSSDGSGGIYLRPKGDGSGTNEFVVYNNGKVKSANFSGNGTQMLVVDNSGYFTAIDHPVYTITQTQIDNWNTASTQSHEHSNKTYLDQINQSLKTDSTVNFTKVIASLGLQIPNVTNAVLNAEGRYYDLSNDIGHQNNALNLSPDIHNIEDATFEFNPQNSTKKLIHCVFHHLTETRELKLINGLNEGQTMTVYNLSTAHPVICGSVTIEPNTVREIRKVADMLISYQVANNIETI